MHPTSIDTDRRPFVLVWAVTRACELACEHCRVDARPGRHPDELTTGEGKRLLEAARRFGDGQLVVLSGATRWPVGSPPLRRRYATTRAACFGPRWSRAYSTREPASA